MLLLKCPKPESLFEYVSIPNELSISEKAPRWLHLKSCPDCRDKVQVFRQRWESLFSPEPDITSSLLRVYSRLQRDETLVLKGWKLGDSRHQKRRAENAVVHDWAFRGAIAASLLGVLGFIGWTQLNSRELGKEVLNASGQLTIPGTSANVPFAQIRIEDKNRIKVHYVQPQLLQTMEFETTNAR